MRINTHTLQAWLEEDLPYFDLTTQLLGVGNQQAKMAYFCRHDAIICGTEEAARLANEVGAKVVSMHSSGDSINAQQVFFEVEGSFTAIPDIVERILNQDCEKQILIEVESVADAEAVMGLPIHGLQYDKFEPALLNTLVAKVRANNPKLIQLAAGGINLSNAADYAATGVDGLVTTSTNFGKPADVGVRFYKL